MLIDIVLDRSRVWRWHSALLLDLRQAGFDAAPVYCEPSGLLHSTLLAALDIDKVLSPPDTPRLAAPISAHELIAPVDRAEGVVDLMINLAGHNTLAANWRGRIITPEYNGDIDEEALWLSLLAGAAPVIRITDSACEKPWSVSLPALAAPWRLAVSADAVFEELNRQLVRTCRAIVRGHAAASSPESADLKPVLPPASGFATGVASNLLRRSLRSITSAGRRWGGAQAKWAVAWRAASGGQGPSDDDRVIDLADYQVLADDGERYFADPFIFAHGGTRHIFVEEFPYDAKRGLISVVALNDQLEAGAVEPVLKAGHHLSYPQVFAHDGAIWMLPEGAGGGGLDLYRSVRFPGEWRLEARLINEPLHDATLLRTADRFWLFAAGGPASSNAWDSLLVYSAPTLLGPWTPACENPILVDARQARPAGPMIEAGDMLWRPTQDCSLHYGGALTWAKFFPTADGGWRQRRGGRLSFSPASRMLGPHTWAQASGLEVIDVFATPAAIASASRRRASMS